MYHEYAKQVCVRARVEESTVLMLLNSQGHEPGVVPTGQELKLLADWRGFSQNMQNTSVLHTNGVLSSCLWLLMSKTFSSGEHRPQ